MDLHFERLDQRVREQLLAHPLDLGPRLGRVARVDLEIDDLPDASLRDGETEVPERALDRFALRIEDAVLRPDEHGCLHPSTTDGFSRYAGNGIVVSRSKASMYFERVCMTTSSGSSGPGSVLSQPVCAQKSRTNCLSKLSCARPGSYESAGQKRDESGVRASSPSTRAPSASRPSSNFVSAMMIPRVRAGFAAAAHIASAGRS